MMGIDVDKWAHFLAGYAITATVVAFGVPLFFAVPFTGVVGICKEVWDDANYDRADLVDAIATALGGFVYAGVVGISIL